MSPALSQGFLAHKKHPPCGPVDGPYSSLVMPPCRSIVGVVAGHMLVDIAEHNGGTISSGYGDSKRNMISVEKGDMVS